jgi:hypothetical protein
MSGELYIALFPLKTIQQSKPTKMKTKFLRIVLSLCLIPAATSVFGQLNYYATGCSNNAGTYTDLGTTGTAITTANFNDANSAPQNIGFTFNFNGAAFTQFVLNTNGFIKLGNTNPSVPGLFFGAGNTTTGGIFNSSNAADKNILAAFNHDLYAGVGTAEYRMLTSGSAGSRICTIQFKNVHDSTSSAASEYDDMNIQIRLYETTNIIEFVYGTWTASTNPSAFKSAAVGLKGSDSTNAQLLVVTKPSTQAWSKASFLAGNYTGNAFNFGNGTRPAPDAGRTLRFAPAIPNDAAVTGLFTLGSLPIPYGAPRVDSAVITNTGTTAMTNVKATLTVSGATTFTSTITIPTLAWGTAATIGFAPYSPATAGTNTVTVTIGTDGDPSNNSATYTQVVNNTIYSYADASPASKTGIGAKGYLLVEYPVTGSASVQSSNIFIANNAGTIGKSLYAVLLDGNGTLLDSSASYVVTAADTAKYHNFAFPKAPSIFNSHFFVGLSQSASGYSPLGYQREGGPVRNGAYFLGAPKGGMPGDLGGVTSTNNYRFMIQAVVSAGTGILEHSINENLVRAYPNPSTAEGITFSVKAAQVNNAVFSLYDVTGKLVLSFDHINTTEFRLERENLKSGVYFYKLNDASNLLGSGKIILE